jgi:hypothetical protein
MKPASSRKTMAAPQRRAFFYPRPVLAHPAANRLLVALDRAGLGLLRAPAQRTQQPPHVIDVIAHPEATLDHLGYSRTRPQLGIESSGQGPLEQHGFEPAPLRSAELARPARVSVSSQFDGPMIELGDG